MNIEIYEQQSGGSVFEGRRASGRPRSLRRSERSKLTLVTEAVTASISLSSADRSLNPGSTCLACSLSRVATERKGEMEDELELDLVERRGRRRDEPLMLIPDKRALTESEVSTL